MAVATSFETEMRDRLGRLERELRYWRMAGGLTIVLAVVTIAAAMDAPAPKELRAETIKLVEPSGKERIVMTALPGIPDLTFLDPAGESRLTLDIADDHKPVVTVSDTAKGKGRLVLGIDDGSPNLQLYDRDGKRRVTFGVPKDTGALIRIYDADGKVHGRFP
jgi:hypothetical protein